ncbi:sucrose-phosphate synthase [Dunaliella salina]|uniref:Sucrose-phosphate synthase n=1 Tax=Dunaliella salina TaxID=3046 RepID=A0ABQ7GE81_DUNSA|nr:sucrose-phosphate synthase [Dunaliella salina]|eukprot:KAF5832922.1 sucrose-phosphate synthase [Dunaliella salina]
MHCVQRLSVNSPSLRPTACALKSAPRAQAAHKARIGMSRLQGPLLLISDIDDTIVGSQEADADSAAFTSLWHEANSVLESKHKPVLAYNSGRNFSQCHDIYREKKGLMPIADMLICGCGTRIFNRSSDTDEYVEDHHWTQHISKDWDLATVLQVLETAKARFGSDRVYHGEPQEQHEHKQTIRVTTPILQEVHQFLATSLGSSVLLIIGGIDPHLRSIDVLPARAGKGHAAEYVRQKLGFQHEHTIVAGDSGNDEGMLLMPGACWHAIVVSNAVPDLMEKVTASLQHQSCRAENNSGKMILSTQPRSAGVMEGLQKLGFLR